DIGRVAGQALKAPRQSAVHVIVLVGRDPGVIGHGVIGQVDGQLLQRRVVLGQWIRRSKIWNAVDGAVGVTEKYLRIMLGGIVVLVGAVIGIEISRGKESRNAAERYCPLILRQGNVRKPCRTRGQVDVFLIWPPRFSSVRQKSDQMLIRVLICAADRLERVVIV